MYYRIDEHELRGHRLGRHVNHDPRSLAYPFKATGVQPSSHRWSTDDTPILDQGQVGSCTGNATVGALLCQPFNSTLSDSQRASLNEDLAVQIYSAATKTDPIPGSYPPRDTGSDGLDVAKAATAMGYISGYTHAFSLSDALAALTIGPIIIGIHWYEGFDDPDGTGLVKISGRVRGGHEVCLDEIDVDSQVVWLRNSWSTSYGLDGRVQMAWDTFDDLLGERGDATVFTPLTVAPPVPTPAPTPTPGDADDTLAQAAKPWVATEKIHPTNEAMRQALLDWLDAKGL
jgi:hypothetical protein